MRALSLELQNHRGFESCRLDLDPRLTLLVGGNGAGKTTLIEAAAGVLGQWTSGLQAGSILRPFQASDVRRVARRVGRACTLEPQWPHRVELQVDLGDGPVAFREAIRGGSEPGALFLSEPWRSPWLLTKLQGHADLIQRGEGALVLPVVALFRSRRGEFRPSAAQPSRGLRSRTHGYIPYGIDSTDASSLGEWFFQQTLIELQRGEPQPAVQAVVLAVRTAIPEIESLVFDIESHEIQIDFASGRRLPFSSLSDGFQMVVGMVTDLAWRCSLLNPQFGSQAAQQTPGVVLIDEVELHLHPKWQRTILPSLLSAFPLAQFVVATHSPQVVASVRPEQVRILGPDGGVTVPTHVHGRDTNALLEDVFGEHERPEEDLRRIHGLAELIDHKQLAAARLALQAIEADLGPFDRDVVRSRRALERLGG